TSTLTYHNYTLTATPALAPSMQQHPTIFFFFNDTATTEIYTLSLHDALPIRNGCEVTLPLLVVEITEAPFTPPRSEEHTSELQSPDHLVCRLLLEKKKKYEKETGLYKKLGTLLHQRFQCK